MPRFAFFRARRRPKYLAIAGAAVTAALVAAMLTQVSGHEAAASPARVPTVEETVAGFIAVAEDYPGGLPALLELFVTGECAGAESYETAPPDCRALIDLIIELGIGEVLPPASSTDLTTITSLPPTSTTTTESSEPTTTPPTTTRPTTTRPTTTPPTTTEPTTSPPITTPPTTTEPTTTPPTTTPTMPPPPTTTPPTTPPPTTTTPPMTTTPPTTTPTTMPPPQPLPPLLVAVGDSVTSGHESRPVRQQNGAVEWRTTCDDPATSWAEDLRTLLGVPLARYFNFAHSGATTANVRAWSPYLNPCGVWSQQARTQLDDAIAVLRANPSRAGAANVAVATAGINDTNWVTVAENLVTRGLGLGGAPLWAVDNVQACTDYVLGNRNGNLTPGAPAGAIQAAWDGETQAGMISAGVARIAIGLIAADPGAQVRYLLYYKWGNDPYIPRNCVQAAQRATDRLNGWIRLGIAVAQLQWMTAGFNPNRISTGCDRTWGLWLGPQNVQMQLDSQGIPNNRRVPGWPHPAMAGRADLAVCVNGMLPRAQGGGVA